MGVLCLQDIGLDTAFLPSLTELVSTARMAKIPEQGPGAITSLCLLDQAVSSRDHLACLSQLSSLAGENGRFHISKGQDGLAFEACGQAQPLQQLYSGEELNCKDCEKVWEGESTRAGHWGHQ